VFVIAYFLLPSYFSLLTSSKKYELFLVWCFVLVIERERESDWVANTGRWSYHNEFALGEEATNTSTPTCLIVFPS